MLSPTPKLESDINSALLEFVNKLFSGDGITEANLDTDPAERATRVCAAAAKAIATAHDEWLNAVQLIILPGLVTVGSPTTQVSSTPYSNIKKV